MFIVSRNYFEFQYVIGRGGFGKVWQVVMKKNNKKYALKEMSKVKIIDRKSEKSIKGERDLLSKLHHPFIVNMVCSFQDYETLYLVMDLLTGGDLRYHLCKMQKFNEEETKFFIACVLLGLEYIHGNNIIHRDIKPENLVCDDKGYIRITDFGVAKVRKEDNSSETSGTPGYMAPEVLLGQNHSFPVDFFAIGVMGYEFIFGERPYIGRSRKEVKHAVLKKQAKIEEDEIPYGWSFESVDFINKCLKRKYSKRLGFENGINELKNHIWFFNFNWEKLYNKNKRAPFIPKKGGNYDRKYCEAIEKISDTTFERYQKYANHRNFGKIFLGYTFINYEILKNNINENTISNTINNSKQNKLQSTSSVTNNTLNKNPKLFQNNKEGEILSNNFLNDKEKLKEKINFKSEEQKEIQKLEKKEELNINDSKNNNNKKKFKLNKKDSYINLKIENDDINKEKKNIINLDSLNNNINNIKNNFKKVEKERKNLRSTSVDISSSNFINILSNNNNNNINYIKHKKKDLDMNLINFNYNNKYKFINGSLSNPNRKKFNFNFKNNNGISSSMLIEKNYNNNSNTKREISSLYLSNNNSYKNNNKFIRSKHIGVDSQSELKFYLPNLNKKSNVLNFYGFKNKTKINLNQLNLKLNNLKNYNNNINNNRFNLKRNFSDFSYKDINKNFNRNLNSSKRKKVIDKI